MQNKVNCLPRSILWYEDAFWVAVVVWFTWKNVLKFTGLVSWTWGHFALQPHENHLVPPVLSVLFCQMRNEGYLIHAFGAPGFGIFRLDSKSTAEAYLCNSALTANFPIFKHEYVPDDPLSTCSKENSQWNDCHNPRGVSSCKSWNLYSSWVLNVSIYKKRWVVFQKLWIH